MYDHNNNFEVCCIGFFEFLAHMTILALYKGDSNMKTTEKDQNLWRPSHGFDHHRADQLSLVVKKKPFVLMKKK
jgi:hypothetical protein